MMNTRTIMAGFGAVAAAGAAVFTGVSLRQPAEEGAGRANADLSGEVCFITPLRFFEEASGGCVAKTEINQWRTALVLDNQGAPVSFSMSHPDDHESPVHLIRTCADYNEMRAGNWYAGTTREMRREAFFERACGALDYLLKAQAPKTSHFINGQCAPEDIRTIMAGPPFRFAEGLQEAPSAQVTLDEIADGVWNMSSLSQTARFQEIAHADFNGDGVGDILAYVAVGPDDATASTGLVGYLLKPEAGAPVRFHQ